MNKKENLNNAEYSKELDLWASLYLFMNELQPGIFVTTKESVLETIEQVHTANLAQIKMIQSFGITNAQLIARIPELQVYALA